MDFKLIDNFMGHFSMRVRFRGRARSDQMIDHFDLLMTAMAEDPIRIGFSRKLDLSPALDSSLLIVWLIAEITG
jgi:hypothetical protein